MVHKLILYIGIIIGLIFSYFLRVINNIWFLIVYTILCLYIDLYCLEPLIILIMNKYYNNNLSVINIEALKYLLVIVSPSLICVFINKIKGKNKE